MPEIVIASTGRHIPYEEGPSHMGSLLAQDIFVDQTGTKDIPARNIDLDIAAGEYEGQLDKRKGKA